MAKEKVKKNSGVFKFLFVLFIDWCHIDQVIHTLKGKSGLDKVIVKKQPYQPLNTNRECFPSFYASNVH